ncbi:ABC transporter ATP-binding protein [Curtobacterium sp. PhB146]|uniref:dipeptide ABC transporter ATP-binding protein n=1 Tax=Curtobacterium sp. PhB146 TaxID=2485187 RepID=UPI001050D9C5|nr:ABC transporter ATP-binding protein [Curtobacterium sp. PhB146]TCU50028.1 peptide/nickel transport system ATP-binding protein [Curtobacterium sp. PhB146]
MTQQPLLSVRDLAVTFTTPSGEFEAIRRVSFDLAAGETLAIVGESGSGKSTTAASVNRLLAENGRISDGSITFDGVSIHDAPERTMVGIRGKGVGLVPQDPMSNLDPIHRVGTQIREALEVHGIAKGAAARIRVVELLEMVGIPEPERRARQYPHELSGGMRQRVLIAMGLACRPKLLIADEPTSALDVTVQRTILDELDRLTSELGTAVLLITHDLPLAAERADTILVMYRGDVVEQGRAAGILARPQHEYTQRLLAAAPDFGSVRLVGDGPATTVHRPTGPDLAVAAAEPLVRLTDVRKEYPIRSSGWRRQDPFVAVTGSTFDIARGETVAVVGGSGSGKSTTAKMVLALEHQTSGSITFDGAQLSGLRGGDLMRFRSRVQPVFQNPYGSLDARWTVRRSIEEPMVLHGIGDAATRKARALDLLDRVALPAATADKLPNEMSGGQLQRVAIARALALQTDLVVLDEAVSALDVVVQEQILELLVELQQELGLAYLFISHDLAVVRMVSHRVHVMDHGQIVESGTPDQIFGAPQHEYTRTLLRAIPGARVLDDDRAA